MKKELVSVKLDKAVVQQLRALAHPGQSLNGIVQELINKAKVGR